MKKISHILYLLPFLSSPLLAQQHEIFNQRIVTLQVVAGSDWQSLPITMLGGNAINIDFDDMTHDYHRYAYKIEHCDANWQVSEGLFDTDYMNAISSDFIIDNTEQSLNTNHLYTHYHLNIPNSKCQLTMSGNYKLTIYDDNIGEEEGKMLTACFMIVDPQTQVSLGYTTNTDIDINKQHQQVNMAVAYDNLRVTNPTRQIKTIVLQNGRWDNAVVNAQPDYISADGLQWKHNRDLIFKAGNEYRKFEMLSLDHPTMGIDEIKWDGTEYQVYTFTGEPRPSYVYDESAKGGFYIRNSDNRDNNFTCDYAQVHFKLKTHKQDGDVYLNGGWTYDKLQPPYRMTYDETDQAYHTSILLKQGYYSYQYLVSDDKGHLQHVDTEGDFFQTANRYDALIYYRGTGDVTDKLVGWKSIK